MPALPLSYNLAKLRQWAEKSEIPFWPNPVAKNSQPYQGRNTCTRCDTCTICPTGAKYTPDFTFQELLREGKIDLLSRTVVRRLVPDDNGREIDSAEALDRDRPDEPVRIRAGTFIVAAGYAWSSYLLLLSRNARFPQGVANSSGLVGCYISGHRPVNAWVEVPMKLYPGIYQMDSLLSKKFQRKHSDQYVRHDFRIWESGFGRAPRMRDRGTDSARRSDAGGLAVPVAKGGGSLAGLLRRAPGPRQPPDVGRESEDVVGGPDLPNRPRG